MTDGIETPENMLRCMSNNYSAMAFWRAWHRSFNRWTIRYIYIPLGGSKRLIINTLAVFTFVAFWHDISLKLLAWGWLVTLFILPEVAARMIMPPKKVTPGPAPPSPHSKARSWCRFVGDGDNSSGMDGLIIDMFVLLLQL